MQAWRVFARWNLLLGPSLCDVEAGTQDCAYVPQVLPGLAPDSTTYHGQLGVV